MIEEKSAIEAKSSVNPRQSFHDLWQLVGNTPLLEIKFSLGGKHGSIFAKCENYNLTGSIKDRMALYILQSAYEQQQILPGAHIVEATSGNTGIAFSAIGKALGHEVSIIMPDWLSEERKAIIRSFGAAIIPVSKEEGGFKRSVAMAEEMAAKDHNVFLPRQFQNDQNVAAHCHTTGPEIARQLSVIGKSPDSFVAGVGTGGTVMGVGQFLRANFPKVSIHPLEPEESPTLTTGHKVGSHRIQGISDEFIPDIVKLDQLDSIVQAADGDSILVAQKLASQLGLAVGISSGANVLGAIKLKAQLGEAATVVTILPDSNKKYLSTDLMKNEPVKAGYLSPHIDFIGFSSVGKKID